MVAVGVPRDVADVWRMLTEPDEVAGWFGDLSEPLATGGIARLDFLDVDLFTLHDVVAEPPRYLRYAWRFLGTGPVNTITWRVKAVAGGSWVTVTDEDARRSADESTQLEEGWLDFTERLTRFARTGASARYDWRREFDGSIELPGTPNTVWALLFAPGQAAEWLPIQSADLVNGTLFTLSDGQEPSALAVSAGAAAPPCDLQFELSHPSWDHATSCHISLNDRKSGTLLSLSQRGWEYISSRPTVQRSQRERLSRVWINALQRALQLVRNRAGVLDESASGGLADVL